jgi:hypothetical protein
MVIRTKKLPSIWVFQSVPLNQIFLKREHSSNYCSNTSTTMRTPDISDEELDRLFQQGAEAFPADAPLAGWQRFEAQLEEAARQHHQLHLRKQLLQRVAGLFVAEMGLVTLFLLLWLHYVPMNPSRSPKLERLLATTSVKPEAASQATVSHSAKLPASREKILDRGVASRETPLGQVDLVTQSGIPEFVEHQETPPESGRVGRPLRMVRRGKPFAEIVNLPADRSRPSRPTDEELIDQGVLGTLSSNTAQPAPSSLPEAQVAGDDTKTIGTTATVKLFPTDSGSVATISSAVPADSSRSAQLPARLAHRWLLGVVGGPEFSAVLPSITPRPGGTVGAVLEYRLTSRLRLRTGVLRSVKRYGARGGDYRPPSTYWTWTTPIDQVDANCRLLEIPLDVRYDLVPRASYALYASVGLTSLILQNERYTYHYELNGQYTARTWSYPRGGEQAFQMLRLAAGYERRFAPRWSFQAEPFVNLPLGGIGFGRMRLSSTGMLVGLRYGLGRPRAPELAP